MEIFCQHIDEEIIEPISVLVIDKSIMEDSWDLMHP